MKLFAIVLVCVLLAIGGLFYFLAKTPVQAPAPVVSTSTSATSAPVSSISDVSYQNDQFGFSFNHPKNTSPTSTFATSYLAASEWSLAAPFDNTTGSKVVAVSLPESNEVKAGELRIGVSTSSTAVKKCLTAPENSGSTGTSSVDIQGQAFTMFSMADAAMSHQLEAKIYRIVHNGACYSIEAIVTGTNPEVYDPPRTVPFSTSMAFDALNAMVMSFSFTQPQAVQTGDTSTSSASPEGMHCGGFIQNAPTCPANYHCQLGRIPDTGGVCVAD